MELDDKQHESNLNNTPVTALSFSTRQIVVNELNKMKVLASASDKNLARDWRGLADLAGLPNPTGDSPTDQLLTAWGRQPNASLAMLEQFLERMDRWDIVDDIYKLIRKDAKVYVEGKKLAAEQQAAESNVDHLVLTDDDSRRMEQGLEPQVYDALLLYADQDEAFARQMLDRLENDYGLKVCLKENLVAGLVLQQGIMKLIRERCRRVIIILSRHFLDSPVNRFFVSFAHALAIEKRKRIIIPCLFEKVDVELPEEIRMVTKLDYNRATLRDYNFWDKLRKSVVQDSSSTVTIREMKSSGCSLKAIEAKAADPPVQPPPYATDETIQCKLDLEVKTSEKLCSTSLNESCKLSCSTLSLTEKTKEKKSKSPSDFIRKLFKPNESKHKKKSTKIAVRL